MSKPRNVVDESRHEWDYLIEPVDNYQIPKDGGKIYPTHQLTFQRDPNSIYNKEKYMVNASDDEVELVKHLAGSGKRYNAHEMFSLRFRAILEDDGYAVIDASENIDCETIDKIESWLESRGVDPKTVDVDVNEKHVTVTISTNNFLEGEDWDAYIEVMRSTPEIGFAQKAKTHYIDDGDLPALLEGENGAGMNR